MIVKEILGNTDLIDPVDSVDVDFEWFELDRKHLKKTASDGTEIGIDVDEPLHDGDILAEVDETSYVVNLLPSELITVDISDIKEMGRVCFELGNRHLPISIDETSVTVPYDEATFSYLVQKGFHTKRITDIFTDHLVVHAHHH